VSPQPRWTIPVNFRAQDKLILDGALNIAREEGTDITKICRTALAEFVRKRAGLEGMKKIDEFLDNSVMLNPIHNRMLTPQELGNWSDNDLLEVARSVRARQEELNAELRKRGFYFRW